MLRGPNIALRTVRQSDLDTLYTHLSDVANRGDYLPPNIQSEPDFRKAVQETGLWTEQRGTLLIVNEAGDILGQVVYFTTVPYMDELELGYQIFDPQQRGKGIATEALNLLVRYLFDSKKVNRLRLVTHPDNKASRRVAEKCGFTQESTSRGALYHKGKNHDAIIYALLRDEAPASTWA